MNIHFSLHRFLLSKSPSSSTSSALQLTPHRLCIIRQFLHQQHLKKQNNNFRLNTAVPNKNQKELKKIIQRRAKNKNPKISPNKNKKSQHLFNLKKFSSFLEPYLNISQIYDEITQPLYHQFLPENHTKTDIILDIAEIYDDDDDDETLNGLLSSPTRQHLLDISKSHD